MSKMTLQEFLQVSTTLAGDFFTEEDLKKIKITEQKPKSELNQFNEEQFLFDFDKDKKP